MDRGAWQVMVHGVAKSWTWLKRPSTAHAREASQVHPLLEGRVLVTHETVWGSRCWGTRMGIKSRHRRRGRWILHSVRVEWKSLNGVMRRTWVGILAPNISIWPPGDLASSVVKFKLFWIAGLLRELAIICTKNLGWVSNNFKNRCLFLFFATLLWACFCSEN